MMVWKMMFVFHVFEAAADLQAPYFFGLFGLG